MNKLTNLSFGGLLAILLCAALPVSAHHSPAAFDLEQKLTVTGVVKKASFRNPHGHLELEVTGDDGKVVMWEVETSAANLLRRRGWDFREVKRGDTISVTGHPHKQEPAVIYIRSIKTADGTLFGDPEGENNALD